MLPMALWCFLFQILDTKFIHFMNKINVVNMCQLFSLSKLLPPSLFIICYVFANIQSMLRHSLNVAVMLSLFGSYNYDVHIIVK